MATDAAAQTAAEGSPAVGSPAGGAPAEGSPAVGSLAGSAPAGGAPAEGTPAAGTPAGSVPPGSDPVFDSLLSALPGLTRDLMWLDADIRDAVTRSELDPAAISAQMEKRADDAMRATNREIAAIREARQALQDHTDRERGGRRAAAREGRVPRRAMALLIAALWLVTAWPVATWQAWPPLASATGGVAAAAVLAFGILALIVTGSVLAGRAGAVSDRSGTTVTDVGVSVAVLGLAIDLAVGFALLDWRLYHRTYVALGHHHWVAQVSWFAGGVVLLGLAAIFILGWAILDADEPAPVAWRLLLYWLAGGIAGTAVTAGRYQPLAHYHGPLGSHLAVALGCATALAVGLALMAVPAALRALLRLALRTTGRRQERELRRAADAADARWRAAAAAVLRPMLRDQIQLMSVPPFATTRGSLNSRGLQHMRSAGDVIETPAFDQLRSLVDTLSGGAVGMAGPRGAGKSTVLEYYGSGRLAAAGTEHLTLLESVPVSYDPREYILYLYATLCERVIGFRRGAAPVLASAAAGAPASRALASRAPASQSLASRALASRAPASSSPASRARSRAAGLRSRSGLLLLLAWLVAVYLGVISLLTRATEPPWLQRAWWLPVVVLALGSVTVALARTPSPAADLHLPPGEVPSLAALQDLAERKLASIRYQMTRTSGWSGSISLPWGIGGGQSTSLELAAQPMTYPEVVSDFRAFLECVTAVLRRERNISPIPVVIILDELDKMTPAERVQDFLNEVKALFTLNNPGCLFLVSVSEDALAMFERRGLPVRDAFDSTFDTILRVDYLALADAVRVVRSRVVRLSAPFICLSYCLSGGLPRELIRYTRQVVNAEQGELAAICAAIAAQELRQKAAAMETIVARNIAVEPYASDLVSFLTRHAVPSAAGLLAAVAAPPIAPGSGSGPDDPVADLIRLQAEALTHMYYCATLLEVFGSLTEDQFTADRHQAGEGSFDALAAARRQFSVNTRLAWLTISSFRAQWDLSVVRPPGG